MKAFLSASPLLMIIAVATAIFGIVVQYQNTRSFNWEFTITGGADKHLPQSLYTSSSVLPGQQPWPGKTRQ